MIGCGVNRAEGGDEIFTIAKLRKKRGEKAVKQSVDQRQTNAKIWTVVLPGALLLGGAGYVSTKNYLIFHTFTELFTIPQTPNRAEEYSGGDWFPATPNK